MVVRGPAEFDEFSASILATVVAALVSGDRWLEEYSAIQLRLQKNDLLDRLYFEVRAPFSLRSS